jgi:histidinol-phosphate aminotransferase
MIEQLIRKNIQQLKPYSTARDEFQGEAQVFLDANENPFPLTYNRYPDPLQKKLKETIAALKEVRPAQLFLGNGSDEAIDLLIRVFCEPYQDSILVTEPTYGMYAVCANINGVTVRRVLLDSNFDLDVDLLFRSITHSTKIIFLCSPNNPSGNLLQREKVAQVVQKFQGIVVVDEAYIDFANDAGFISALSNYPNLVVLQTLSKAWGLAALRLGMCYASEEIIDVLSKVKYPYNINSVTQELACTALRKKNDKERFVKEIIKEREKLKLALLNTTIVTKVHPSDANFLLIKVTGANRVYKNLLNMGIIVRNRSSVTQCEDCLRITVGTKEENEILINALKKYEKGSFYRS